MPPLAGLGRSELPVVAQFADQHQYACKYCQKSLMLLLFSAVIQFAASNEFVNSTTERC